MRLPDIVRTRHLPHPIESVWAALTDPDALADWLMPNDFRPVQGHDFTFRTEPGPGFDGIVHARVETIEPPHLLELGWRGGGIDTRVRFELERLSDDATRLTLRHAGFSHADALARLFLGFGWRWRVLPALAERLANRAGAT